MGLRVLVDAILHNNITCPKVPIPMVRPLLESWNHSRTLKPYAFARLCTDVEI